MQGVRVKFDRLGIPGGLYLIGWFRSLDRELISMIYALEVSGGKGCIASNQYFAELLGIDSKTVSNKLSIYKKEGIIERTSKNGQKRVIRITPEFSGKYMEGSELARLRTGQITFPQQGTTGQNNSLTREEVFPHTGTYTSSTISNTLFLIERGIGPQKNQRKITINDKGLWSGFRDRYTLFMIEEAGFTPGSKEFAGKNGTGLKELIVRLCGVAKDRGLMIGEDPEAVKAFALDSWNLILNNWKNLDNFEAKRLTLREINTDFVRLVKCLKSESERTKQNGAELTEQDSRYLSRI